MTDEVKQPTGDLFQRRRIIQEDRSEAGYSILSSRSKTNEASFLYVRVPIDLNPLDPVVGGSPGEGL